VADRPYDESQMKYGDLQGLANDSTEIVVGTTQRFPPTKLSGDGRDVIRHVRVQLGEVLKGGLVPTQTIVVLTSGGRVSFEDGTSAEVHYRGFVNALDSERQYVLFLTPDTAGEGFVPVGSMQGVFGVNAETRKIHPADYRHVSYPFSRQYRGMDLDVFLSKIRAIVGAAAQ
jgi:hypothetical protein